MNLNRASLIKYLFYIITIGIILLSCLISHNLYSIDKEYIHYKVEKKDTLLKILKKHSLKPTYGKNGYLKEILKLNPKKINTKGNLIYPGEIIKIPLLRSSLKNDKAIENKNNHSSIKNHEFSSAITYKYNNDTKDIKKLPENHVYLIYKVKKNDMISVLLKKYRSFPIYGKKGTLSETLELNPNKKPTKGDLIFPNELIKLPIPIEILLQLSDEEKKSLRLIYFDNEKGVHEEISYFDFINKEDIKEKFAIEKNKIEKNNFTKDSENKIENKIPNSLDNYKIKLFGKITGKKVELKWLRKENKKLTYEIRRSINRNNDFVTFETNYLGNKIIDYEIILGQVYYYQVIGKDRLGSTIESNIIELTTPPTGPKKLTAQLNNNTAQLNWENSLSKSEIKYEIYRSIHPDKGYRLLEKDVKNNSYIDSTIKPSYTYYYKVKAIDIFGNNNVSEAVKLNSYPPPVKLAAYLKPDYIYLEWNKAQLNTNITYDIYRSTHENNQFQLIFSDYKGNFARDREIIKNEIYFYKVVARNSDNISQESNIVEVLTSLDKIFLQAEANEKTVKLYWNKIAGSNKFNYLIYRSNDQNNEFTLIKEDILQNQFIDTDLIDGQKYFYKVIGIDKLKNKKESNIVTIIIDPKKITQVKLSLNPDASVQIDWEIPNSSTPVKYKILKSYSVDKDFIPIAEDLSQNTYLDTSSKMGQKVYYKVLVKNDNQKEIESAVSSIIIPPAAPKKLIGRLEQKEIILEWENISSNLPVTYEIYRGMENSENLEFFSAVNNTTIFQDKTISPDEDYYYSVKAKVENMNSAFSDIIKISSFSGMQVASSLQTGFNLSYYKLQEFNKIVNSEATLHSAPSLNSYVTLRQNWDENLKSYFGLGVVYFDLLSSPIYTITEREFFLPYLTLGISKKFLNSIFLEYKNVFSKELYYQSNIDDLPQTMQDKSVFITNHFFLAGYDFGEKNNLHLSPKIGYILTLPEGYNISQSGHGYHAEVELFQQYPHYGLGLKIFYTHRTTETNNVTSVVTENGILFHLTFDLGYL